MRLFQIGNDAFWFDEINVLQAVSRPNLWEAIRVTHEHVMAMPLHYALVWLFGQVSTSAGWMRLPEAIWGTAAIGVGYYVARYYLTPSQATLSAWIMATSPLLVMYSQELRFYSGLLFFYLLVVFLGLKAIAENRGRDWLLFCTIGMVGLTFHVYVLLALGMVYAYLMTDLRRNKERGALRSLVRSTIFLLIAFLGLLVSFGRLSKDPHSLTREFGLIQSVLAGVGWAAPFPLPWQGWIYYFVIAASALLGLCSSRKAEEQKKQYLLLVIVAQICLIVVLNRATRYFITPRQFIFLAPFLFFYSAIGIERLYRTWKSYSQQSKPYPSRVLQGVLIAIAAICAFPALMQYYRLEKGIVREALPVLRREWKQGDLICVYPGLDAVTYAYYWREELGASIFPCNELEEKEKSKVRFLLAPPEWQPPSDFHLLFRPIRPTLHERWIWKRTS
ncbi:MAG: glycosyltransferase family 39 protein [Anaerolineales bacterium]|nr:glycosyltransferase family 39 protein [Anaerolineales bacterium]MDW8447505.1 glycosyltransferase family 39 protein [Anaerolineales bacterium]